MGLAITLPDLSDSGGYSGGYGGSCVHAGWQAVDGHAWLAHSLVGSEHRLIASWGARMPDQQLRTDDQCGASTARLSPFLQVLNTAVDHFRKSAKGYLWFLQMMSVMCGGVQSWCIGAYGDSIPVPLGHLIWQLREPAGLRRRRDWASFSVDEARTFSGSKCARWWSQDPEDVNVAAVSWRHID